MPKTKAVSIYKLLLEHNQDGLALRSRLDDSAPRKIVYVLRLAGVDVTKECDTLEELEIFCEPRYNDIKSDVLHILDRR